MKYRDPVTDDELSRGEYISWMVQSIIRRWTFLCIHAGAALMASTTPLLCLRMAGELDVVYSMHECAR